MGKTLEKLRRQESTEIITNASRQNRNELNDKHCCDTCSVTREDFQNFLDETGQCCSKEDLKTIYDKYKALNEESNNKNPQLSEIQLFDYLKIISPDKKEFTNFIESLPSQDEQNEQKNSKKKFKNFVESLPSQDKQKKSKVTSHINRVFNMLTRRSSRSESEDEGDNLRSKSSSTGTLSSISNFFKYKRYKHMDSSNSSLFTSSDTDYDSDVSMLSISSLDRCKKGNLKLHKTDTRNRINEENVSSPIENKNSANSTEIKKEDRNSIFSFKPFKSNFSNKDEENHTGKRTREPEENERILRKKTESVSCRDSGDMTAACEKLGNLSITKPAKIGKDREFKYVRLKIPNEESIGIILDYNKEDGHDSGVKIKEIIRDSIASK